MKRHRNSALICAALLVAFAAGCKKNEEPPAAPPPPAAQPPKPAAPAAPVQKAVSSAAKAHGGSPFDFKNRRDPFKPFEVAKPAATTSAEPSGQPAAQRPSGELLPIQSYEVSRFKLSGIVAGLTRNRALLVDPQGKPYVVQEGMAIGSNDGMITRITASSVEVVERFRDDAGRLKKRKVVLTLAKKR